MPAFPVFQTTLLSLLRTIFSLRRVALWLPLSSQAPRIHISTKTWSSITGVYHRLAHIERLDKYGSDEYSEDSELYTSTTSSCSALNSEDEAGIYRRELKNYSYRQCNSVVPPEHHLHAERKRSKHLLSHHELASSNTSLSSNYSHPSVTGSRSNTRNRFRHKKQIRTYHRAFSRSHDKSIASRHPGSHASLKTITTRSVNADQHYTPPATQSDSRPTSSLDRINRLESELARLRSQLAQLIVTQEGKQLLLSQEIYDDTNPPATSTPARHRLEADGESDTGVAWLCAGRGDAELGVKENKHRMTPVLPLPMDNSFSDRSTVPPAPLLASPIPRPPPPPPPPLLARSIQRPPVTDWRTRLIAAKNKKMNLTTDQSLLPITEPADMYQVLKELQTGSFKLRSIPRSPGGTPVREKHSLDSSAMDPGTIISRALKKKFHRFRAVFDSSHSGEFSPDNSPMRKSVGRDDCLHSGENWKPTTSVCTSATQSSPAFGQHLLRPTGRNIA